MNFSSQKGSLWHKPERAIHIIGSVNDTCEIDVPLICRDLNGVDSCDCQSCTCREDAHHFQMCQVHMRQIGSPNLVAVRCEVDLQVEIRVSACS